MRAPCMRRSYCNQNGQLLLPIGGQATAKGLLSAMFHGVVITTEDVVLRLWDRRCYRTFLNLEKEDGTITRSRARQAVVISCTSVMYAQGRYLERGMDCEGSQNYWWGGSQTKINRVQVAQCIHIKDPGRPVPGGARRVIGLSIALLGLGTY